MDERTGGKAATETKQAGHRRLILAFQDEGGEV